MTVIYIEEGTILYSEHVIILAYFKHFVYKDIVEVINFFSFN